MGLFEASQRKSRVLSRCVQHMDSTWLDTLSVYTALSVCLSSSQRFGLEGFDDGPKQSSSSLWTLVMRISCFLLQHQPIKGFSEHFRLFLDCDAPFVFRPNGCTVATCMCEIWTDGSDKKRLDFKKKKIKELAERRRGILSVIDF